MRNENYDDFVAAVVCEIGVPGAFLQDYGARVAGTITELDTGRVACAARNL